MICVHASGVITAERSRQSLDALLATPLTGPEILRQKMAGVWRLIGVLCVPFGTIYLLQLEGSDETVEVPGAGPCAGGFGGGG